LGRIVVGDIAIWIGGLVDFDLRGTESADATFADRAFVYRIDTDNEVAEIVGDRRLFAGEDRIVKKAGGLRIGGGWGGSGEDNARDAEDLPLHSGGAGVVLD
jgi:hypothetical protein